MEQPDVIEIGGSLFKWPLLSLLLRTPIYINKIIIITDYYNDSSLNSVQNGTN